jgi:hypothetical protein
MQDRYVPFNATAAAGTDGEARQIMGSSLEPTVS